MNRPTPPPAPPVTAPDALLGTYVRPPFLLVEGKGTEVRDADGRTYLDFTAGIGVNALGHGHPAVAEAVRGALQRGLIHTSNLFRTAPGEALARRLVALTFPGQVFFCNSGAEANEAAFKFARRWAGEGRTGILAFRGSFHGRLFGTLAATDRPAYREPFEPLMPGVRFADVGDDEGVAALLGEGETAAVIIEPVQGEGGIVPVPPEFLKRLRTICDRHGVLLIFDEVQCGLGRTGTLFAYEEAGVLPDLLTLAKPLAGGLPMGAVVVSSRVAGAVRPGDHATTFGGGPLVASAALAVLAELTAPGFLDAVNRKAARLRDALEALGAGQVRGQGLMLGLVLPEGRSAAEVVSACREAGLLLVTAGPDVVRFLPPLTVTDEEIDAAVELLGGALESRS